MLILLIRNILIALGGKRRTKTFYPSERYTCKVHVPVRDGVIEVEEYSFASLQELMQIISHVIEKVPSL